MAQKNSLFELGDITITQNAYTLLATNKVKVDCLLQRHVNGDWGNVSDTMAHNNSICITGHNRITSIYPVGKRNVVWIVTDLAVGTHSAHTYIIRPEEYAHVCTTR